MAVVSAGTLIDVFFFYPPHPQLFPDLFALRARILITARVNTLVIFFSWFSVCVGAHKHTHTLDGVSFSPSSKEKRFFVDSCNKNEQQLAAGLTIFENSSSPIVASEF